MPSAILEALITFWIQSTPQKLFERFQESRKSYNYSTSAKSLLLWNQENEYSIFFFSIWVPWHVIDSLYFPNNFWQISQCGLLMCFDIHFVTAFEKHIKLELQQPVHWSYKPVSTSLGITAFITAGVCKGLSASSILSINWWMKVLKM